MRLVGRDREGHASAGNPGLRSRMPLTFGVHDLRMGSRAAAIINEGAAFVNRDLGVRVRFGNVAPWVPGFLAIAGSVA